MSTVSNIVPKSRFRRVSKGGAFSASRFNASLEELVQEVQELQAFHNDTIVPLLDALPKGSDDDEFPGIGDLIDPLQNGLSGDQIWIDETATSDSIDLFYSADDSRKLTIKESVVKLASRIDDNYAVLQSLIEDVDAGVSSYTRSYIGLTAFDETLSSSMSSMDGRISANGLNIDQLKADAFGTPYSLDSDGNANLSYPLLQIIDALLDQHGGTAYKSGYTWGTTVTLTGATVTTGDLTLTTRIPSSWITKVDPVIGQLARAAPVVHLGDEIMRLRYELARLKSPVAAWNNDAGVAPPHNSAVVSLGAHARQFGSGTADNSNPHGLDLINLDSWTSARDAITDFTGMTNILDNSTTYSAHGGGALNVVGDGDPLEEAIYDLDQAIGGIGVAGASVFIYQPGGVAVNNVYTSWSNLVAALGLVYGRKIVMFDDSVTSPCPVPPGTYDMKDVTLVGRVYEGEPNAVVRFFDGAAINNLRAIGDGLEIRSTSTSPIYTVDGDTRLLLSGASSIRCTTAPFISVASGVDLALEMNGEFALVRTGYEVVRLESYATLTVNAYDGVSADNHTIRGVSTSSVLLNTYGAGSAISGVHANLPGSFSEILIADADNIGYDNGASGLAATDVQSAIDEVVSTAGSESLSVNAVPAGKTLNIGSDIGDVFTNEGTGSLTVFNLPPASAGRNYFFYNQDSDNLQVVAAGTNTIRMGGIVSGGGGNIQSTAVGDSVRLIAINNSEWVVVGGFTGTWTVT
jgi:hypothetical protein